MSDDNPDVLELAEPRPVARDADALSRVIGSDAFATAHPFDDLRLRGPGFVGQQLRVARFYWAATPPVCVDFKKGLPAEEQIARLEVQSKRDYCKARGYQYLLLADAYDTDTADELLHGARPAVGDPSMRRRRRAAA